MTIKKFKMTKVRSMRFFLKVFSLPNLFLLFPSTALAHVTEEIYEEPPASIDPGLAIIVVLGVAVAGFLVWKFVLAKK